MAFSMIFYAADLVYFYESNTNFGDFSKNYRALKNEYLFPKILQISSYYFKEQSPK